MYVVAFPKPNVCIYNKNNRLDDAPETKIKIIYETKIQNINIFLV